jgi:hypothetical protein
LVIAALPAAAKIKGRGLLFLGANENIFFLLGG